MSLRTCLLMIPNRIRVALGCVWNRMFSPFFAFYYRYGSSVPPLRYYLEGFKHLEDVDWGKVREMYLDDYDPVCFPLPLRINCLGCMGCCHVSDPPLHPDKHKGPWMVSFHPRFLEQYEGMFGKQATFDLVDEMRQHNEAVERAA